MKCVLLHQTIAEHDAIGNDIAHAYGILKRKHEVFVYCDYLINDKVQRINRDALSDVTRSEDNLLVYHHSIYWEEGEEILRTARAKVIIRYHCITPAFFFKPYSDDHYMACRNGRAQTRRILDRHNDFLWMGDSYYNLVDAGISGRPNAVVVPPFNKLGESNRAVPDEGVLKLLMESSHVNLLFVGRIAPNKGHKHLIEVLRDYTWAYDNNVTVYIIGKEDEGLYRYSEEVKKLVADYKLERQVRWAREVNDSALLSYYLGCDFYINCSDHEGFGIPIVEAQSVGLPVISKRAGAIPETAGTEQLLLGENVEEYSCAIRLLSNNKRYKEHLIREGHINYLSRFSNSVIEKRFLHAVQSYTGKEL
jgi:glycosyltransferase involved in cell wall biosynthesis